MELPRNEMAAIANNITAVRMEKRWKRDAGKREIADRILIAECVF